MDGIKFNGKYIGGGMAAWHVAGMLCSSNLASVNEKQRDESPKNSIKVFAGPPGRFAC